MLLPSPEFCYPNFIDLGVNPNFSITLSTNQWVDANVKYLYDNYKGEIFNDAYRKVLHSVDCASDSIHPTITIDFGDDLLINTVKLLNTNLKSGVIESSVDGVTWNTISTITDLATSSYHYYASGVGIIGTEWHASLTDEDYDTLITEDYFSYYVRYVRITFNTTQIINDEKYIGELYIGRRIFKLNTGKLLSLTEDYQNDKSDDITLYNGMKISLKNNTVYQATMIFKNVSYDEYQFIKKFTNLGGNFAFFPMAGEFSSELDLGVEKDDVYLVTSRGNFNTNPYGKDASGTLTLDIMETINVL